MAEVQRYRDPENGQLWTLTAEEAATRGFVLASDQGADNTTTSGAAEGVQIRVDGRGMGEAVTAATTTSAPGGSTDSQNDDAADYPRHVGGGVYELANGDRVRGKDDAEAAQAEIDAASQKTESESEPEA